MTRAPAPPQDRYVSLAEASAMLGATKETIRRYIAAGRLPGYRLGGKDIRLKLADVEKLLTPIVPTVAVSNEKSNLR